MDTPGEQAFEAWWEMRTSVLRTGVPDTSPTIQEAWRTAWTEATRRAVDTIDGWPETTCSCCVHIRPILNDIAAALRAA